MNPLFWSFLFLLDSLALAASALLLGFGRFSLENLDFEETKTIEEDIQAASRTLTWAYGCMALVVVLSCVLTCYYPFTQK